MELGECGHLSCHAPWIIDESSSAPKWTAHPNGNMILHLDVLFSLPESFQESIPPLQISFSFAAGNRITQASFASNARFVEAYSRPSKSHDLQYVKTFRGASNPSPGSDPDVLAHSLELSVLSCLVLKMVSIRPPQSKECFLLGLEMEVDMSAQSNAASFSPKDRQPITPVSVSPRGPNGPPAARAGTARPAVPPPVEVGGGETIGMLMHAMTGMLVQAQTKLVGQMSALLDQKLSPIVQRLDRLEAQLESLQIAIGARTDVSSLAQEDPQAPSHSNHSVS